MQVIKGASGGSFGVGSIGGIINQTSKFANLDTATSVDQGGGSGSTYRTTVDSNIKLADTTALRVTRFYAAPRDAGHGRQPLGLVFLGPVARQGRNEPHHAA